MVRLHFTPDAPQPSRLYFNNEEQIGVCLNILLDQAENTPLIIRCPEPQIAEDVALHLAGLLPSLVGQEIFLFWHTIHSGEALGHIGLAFKNHFLDLFATSSIREITAEERNVLGFSRPELNGRSVKNYYREEFQALVSKLGRSAHIFIIDGRAAEDLPILEQSFQFIQYLLATPTRSPKFAMLIVDPGTRFNRGHLVDLSVPSNWFMEVYQKAVNQHHANRLGPAPSRASVSSQDATIDDDLRHAVQTLALLNCTARRHVLQYIKSNLPSKDTCLQYGVESGLVQPTISGGVRLTRPGHRSFQEDLRANPKEPQGGFMTIVPNSAKVLSFQTLHELIPYEVNIDVLEKSLERQLNLLEGFSDALTALRRGSANWKQQFKQLEGFSRTAPDLYTPETESQSRVLIRYLSQLLLLDLLPDQSQPFELLESITYGFADYLGFNEATDSKRYEASRWITNLGYVFDSRLGPQGISVGEQPAEDYRNQLYQSAANYLADVQPRKAQQRAFVKYTRAWQLWDSGNHDAAIHLFWDSAFEIFLSSQSLENLVEELSLRQMAYEFAIIALGLRPNHSLSNEQVSLVLRFVRECGVIHDIQEIQQIFQRRRPSIVRPLPAPQAEDCLVVSCISDFHVASLVASQLIHKFGRSTKLILTPKQWDSASTEAEKGEALTQFLRNLPRATLAILIGAPDTSGGIGALVSAIDSDLLQLYQMNIADHYSTVSEMPIGEQIYFTLSGCGLGANHQAWYQLLDNQKTQLQGETKMDFWWISLLAKPFFDVTRDRVYASLLTSISKRVTQKLRPENSDEDSTLQQDVQETVEKMAARVRDANNVQSDLLPEDAPSGIVLAAVRELRPSTLSQVLHETTLALQADGLELEELYQLIQIARDFTFQLTTERGQQLTTTTEKRLFEYLEAFREFERRIAAQQASWRTRRRYDEDIISRLELDFIHSVGNLQRLIEDRIPAVSNRPS